MRIEVYQSYDPIKKAESDTNNPDAQKWEELMWDIQQSLPWAKDGEKWLPLEKIF